MLISDKLYYIRFGQEEHSGSWDGKDRKGTNVGSGVYFYQLKVGDQTEAKKMVLVR